VVERDHLVVENANAPGGDRTHGEFGMPGQPELSHHEHVKGRLERAGDFVGDWNTASRQREHDHIRATFEMVE
jgi:hypothetical protein